MRDLFCKILRQQKLSVLSEYTVSQAYTMFQGRLDLVLLPTTKKAAVSSMVVTEEEEEGEGMCTAVEVKKATQQATVQALAGCHGLLAAEVVRALKLHCVVDKATAYAFELRRGATRLHRVMFNFCDNKSSVSTFPEAGSVGDTTDLINYMIAALQ